jgi:flagellar motor switch protein FliN/FliY
VQEDGGKPADQAAPPAGQTDGPAGQPNEGPADPDRESLPEQDVEFLLEQAEQALQSIGGQVEGDLPPGAKTYRLEEIRGAPASTEKATIDLIRDVELDLKIELGRTHMYLEDVLKLRKGSVVPLDKLAGDPVDVYVNGRLIARGEVLVLNDNFCVRVAELIAGSNAAP